MHPKALFEEFDMASRQSRWPNWHRRSQFLAHKPKYILRVFPNLMTRHITHLTDLKGPIPFLSFGGQGALFTIVSVIRTVHRQQMALWTVIHRMTESTLTLQHPYAKTPYISSQSSSPSPITATFSALSPIDPGPAPPDPNFPLCPPSFAGGT